MFRACHFHVRHSARLDSNPARDLQPEIIRFTKILLYLRVRFNGSRMWTEGGNPRADGLQSTSCFSTTTGEKNNKIVDFSQFV